jgi:OmpA-OmpF porin, OOP family
MKNIFIVAAMVIASCNLYGQIDLKGKAKNKTIDRADQRSDDGIDRGLDAVEEGVIGLFKKKDKNNKVQNDENTNIEHVEGSEIEEKSTKNISERPQNQAFSSYSKYDFVPGEKIIFYDDFANTSIGDFPMNWDTQASGEVVTTNNYSGKWLMMKGDYSYFTPIIKDLDLPENFTLEFEVICPEQVEFSVEIYENETGEIDNYYYPGNGGTYIGFNQQTIDWKTWLKDDESGRNGDANHKELSLGKKVRYSIWGQKTRLRVYCNEEKVLDVPRGIIPELKMNYIRFCNYPDYNMLISNIRIAVGAADTRSRLLTEGKLVTRGILFDSGSDKIKPESFGVLKEIAGVLSENQDVKVKIVGHTDSDGDELTNLDLSKRRAIAIKNALVSDLKISADRMQTDGKGESEPVSPNNTSEGKANNRRVEFIRL